jgi:hypothetical protein
MDQDGAAMELTSSGLDDQGQLSVNAVRISLRLLGSHLDGVELSGLGDGRVEVVVWSNVEDHSVEIWCGGKNNSWR